MHFRITVNLKILLCYVMKILKKFRFSGLGHYWNLHPCCFRNERDLKTICSYVAKKHKKRHQKIARLGHAFILRFKHTYKLTYTHLYMHSYIHTHIHVHTYINIYIHTPMHTYIRIYTFTHTNMHPYIHT